MGPKNGKCAETARGVFRNEGGVQITVGGVCIDRGEGVYINLSEMCRRRRRRRRRRDPSNGRGSPMLKIGLQTYFLEFPVDD